MTRQQYRLIYLGLGLLLVGIVGIGWALTTSTSSDAVRSEVIEDLSPEPFSQAPRQVSIDVDIPVDYQLEIWIDFRGSGDLDANWVRVPPAEIIVIEATGEYSYRPLPGSPFLEEWAPGDQRVRLVWNTKTGIPDPGTYEFSFRVF